jgi:hypothetical protein
MPSKSIFVHVRDKVAGWWPTYDGPRLDVTLIDENRRLVQPYHIETAPELVRPTVIRRREVTDRALCGSMKAI